MSQDFWAVTCLFNPAGYRIRNENYRRFRQELSLPLLTVELSFDGRFTLTENDAEILIQIEGGDVMWQKERLLNIGIAALPPSARKVLWIDADVILPGEQWISQVSTMLEVFSTLQPFATVNHLNAPFHAPKTQSSMAAVQEAGDFASVIHQSASRGTSPCSGYVWAANAELLRKHGLYDGCIVGGGDTAWLCAATGSFDAVMDLHSMNQAQRRRYLNWAIPVHQDTEGRVAHMEAQIGHLWHGSWKARKGRSRHQILLGANFNPYLDIGANEREPWSWTSDKPDLHQAVSDYFQSRAEDEVSLEDAR